MANYQFINTAEALEQCCASLKNSSILAVDTEFVRERTFYPQPGLFQVSDGSSIYLIDPKAIEQLQRFFDLLEDPNIQVIMHSCSEDIELLNAMGCGVVRNLFDTQVAANWLGMGQSLSLVRLVEHYKQVVIEKELTRTDWLARPLSDAQLNYAAIDVLYLHDILQQQQDELKTVNFYTNVVEDSDLRCIKKMPDDQLAYLKVNKAKTITGENLKTLKNLAAWRERRARLDDRPRQHVVKDKELLELSINQPVTLDQLNTTAELLPSAIRRYGAEILNEITSAQTAVTVDPVLSFRSLPGAGNTLNACRDMMVTIHLEKDMPREVLPSKRWLQQFLLHQAASWYPMPEGWSGWRKELLEEPLHQIISTNRFNQSS